MAAALLAAWPIRAHVERGRGYLAGVMPMRDWVLIVAPLAVVMYFLVFPSHFTALIAWLIG
jgi:hypothetical protein